MAALSDAEMLVLLNERYQAVLKTGASYEINGRRIQNPELASIQEQIEKYEARVARASDATGSFGLAQFRGSV